METDDFSLTSQWSKVTTEWNNETSTTGSTGFEPPPRTLLNLIIGLILTTTTFFGQILVLYIFKITKKLHQPSNYFIVSLALADLCISIISIPMWTIYSYLNYFPFSNLVCDIWNSLDYAFCVTSIYTILVISLDRLVSLTYPLHYRVMRTHRNVIIALAVVWVISIVWYGSFIFITNQKYSTPQDRLAPECVTYYVSKPSLTFMNVMLCIWSPIIITVIVYCRIFCIAMAINNQQKHMIEGQGGPTKSKKKTKKIQKDSASQSVSQTQADSDDDDDDDNVSAKTSHTSISVSSESSKGQQTAKRAAESESDARSRRLNKEKKTLFTVGLLLGGFLIGWSPLGVIFLYTALTDLDLSSGWMVFGYWMGYVNSAMNPICYAIGNPLFKEALIKIFCGGGKNNKGNLKR